MLASHASAGCPASRRYELVLLDNGWSCQEVADALLLNDDTIRGRHKLFEQRGIVDQFRHGRQRRLFDHRAGRRVEELCEHTLPRSTREVGAFIEQQFGLVYERRSELIALLRRLGLEYHKPNVIACRLDMAQQKDFIESYDKLLNFLGNDEVVLFVDAVHPTHAARPVGHWAQKQAKLAIEQTSGRERINIYGAIDLETGQARMIDVETANAASTVTLLGAIEALYPMLALIPCFSRQCALSSSCQAGAKMACPATSPDQAAFQCYCPHLDPIERLWGLMHRNVTHNKTYMTCAQFAYAALGFLRDEGPRNRAEFCDAVTDNFCVINPKDFRVVTPSTMKRCTVGRKTI